MPTPDDFSGPAGMIADIGENPDIYEPLLPLAQRGPTSVKLSRPQGDDEMALALRFGYSQPITQISKLAQKVYGYMRDGNVTELDEKAAIMGSNALNDLIMDAPCVTRQERYDDEEERAKTWLGQVDPGLRRGHFKLDPYMARAANDNGVSHGETEEDEYDMTRLLHQWAAADAFMLQARVDEERYGIDYAERHYDAYDRAEEDRRRAELQASELEPAENMLFWCRVRQYKIMRERAFDLAMGYPVHDFSQVKREIAEGKDIHDVAPRMSWAFLAGYHRVIGSMLDGQEHRMQIVAMIAGQIPVQPHQMPWGLPPGYWNGQGWPNGNGGGDGQTQGQDPEQRPDKRPALFSLFSRTNGPQNGAQPQQKAVPNNRRRRRPRGGDR